MKSEIKIGHYSVGKAFKPLVIAEMSGNHNQSLDRALAIVDAAAEAGADAIKLQTYTADTMTLNLNKNLFKIDDETSLWKGESLYDLYKKAYTPWEWHKPLFDRAKELGMLAFSSPFDVTSVDFLETLDVPAYKIASFENTDWGLLKKVVATDKPIIMSTGLANVSDIDESVRIMRGAGCEDFILLKCTSSYPANPYNTNLATIPHMSALFDCQVGLSDHTMGVGAPVAAIALGATVIEKHFTLSRADGGVDSTFSLEPHELKSLVIETERAWQSLGQVKYGIQDTEIKSLRFKRSIYVVKDIAAGERYNTDNLRVIRPGDGIQPKHFDNIIGMKAVKDIAAGTPFTWDLLN
ncbi:MAG: pseudaminic acid synthase [Bacteroidota bacterium]|nr:pseudaminic acid synthase [Bacteroidota bacterium]